MFLDTDTAGQSVTEALWGRASRPDTPGAGPGHVPLPVVCITRGDLIIEPRWGRVVVVTGVSIVIRDSFDDRSQWLYLVAWEQHRFAPGLPAVTGVEAMGGADEVRVFPRVSNEAAVAAQAAA